MELAKYLVENVALSNFVLLMYIVIKINHIEDCLHTIKTKIIFIKTDTIDIEKKLIEFERESLMKMDYIQSKVIKSIFVKKKTTFKK